MNQHSFSFGQPFRALSLSYVCWSRMQAEAGQPLSAIVERKEFERRAGNGMFFWGVGNAPSRMIRPLARAGVPIPMIFSVMKSAPKKVDEHPTGTVAWNGYIDCEGVERDIPDHVLVTSRSETSSGPKSVHYALICRSEQPLVISEELPFDHRQYRNAGTGGAIGASQVTALLEMAEPQASAPAEYRQNLVAELTGSYWVKLTRPTPIKAGACSLDVSDLCDYRRAVERCRSARSAMLPAAELLL